MYSSVDQVLPGMWIGDHTAANDLLWIKIQNIRLILSVEARPNPVSNEVLEQVEVVRTISVLDVPEADILNHLDEAVGILDEGVLNGVRVLVHCFHGVSRSATVILAYLMKRHHYSLDQAWALLRSKRPSVQPNEGFWDQLRLYEAMKCALDHQFEAYRLFRLYCDSGQNSPDSGLNYCKGDRVFRCRKCRTILASSKHVFSHSAGQNLKWQALLDVQVTPRPVCSQGLFVEPMLWMGSLDSNSLVKCFKCGFKLGRRCLSQCVTCSCSGSIEHGCWLNLARIDPSTVT